MKVLSKFLSVVALIGVLVPAKADTHPRPVGMVQMIEARKEKPARVTIEREGEAARNLLLGEYVFERDHIRVPDANATVVIAKRGGRLTICPPGSLPEQCVATIAPQDTLDAVVSFNRSLMALVGWYGRESAANAVQMTTRGDAPPKFPMAGSEAQRVKAGTRPLWIQWSNGEAPFVLRVAQGERTLYEAESQTAREVSVPATKLEPGPIQIEVTDAQSRKVALKAEAVAALPAAPDFSASAPDKPTETYLAAAWLSSQGNGVYLLEAASRLTPLVEELPPARALRKAFGAGQRVK